MKKIVIALAVLLGATSCASKRDVKQAENQRDSLSVVVASKDSLINDIFFSLNLITENLATIKEREKIISTSMTGSEIGKQPTVQINDDLQTIDQLLNTNRQTIARLERNAAELKKANINILELNKTITNLTAQLEQRDSEIATLKSQLGSLSENIADLNVKMSNLAEDRSRLETEIKAGTDHLNTVYYIVGSQKELIDKNIIYKSGVVGRTLRLNENRGLDNYTKVDLRDFDQILIDKKGVKMVTAHPTDSYQIIMGDKGEVKSIQITDKPRFWESSKVLVISYK